jgi:PTH1 family peptidyl-tRNA hydrolase
MWLIAGLGNPGSKYVHTWHNCGYMALEVLAQRNRIVVGKAKYKGEYGQGTILGEKVILLRPHTYMNLSGESIREAMEYFKITASNLIVMYDDVDLPMGTVRVRSEGGPGTHNGMKSVISCLGTQSFARIRVGCGPVPDQWDLADFVLSDIGKEEQQPMFSAFVVAAEAAENIIKENA